MRPINQFVGKICFFHWGPDRGAVNPEMINAPMWLAKAKNDVGRKRVQTIKRCGARGAIKPGSPEFPENANKGRDDR